MQRFHSTDGLYFTRQADGGVTITKTDGRAPDEGGVVQFEQTLDAGAWCSAVLSMTAYGERPHDWHAWMKHHQGAEDLLAGAAGK